jgi:hypothetical protein
MTTTTTIQVQTGDAVRGYSSQYTSTVLLDGRRRYAFSFYVISDGSWFVDVLNPTTRAVEVAGVGLTVGLSILYPYRYKGAAVIPQGHLWVHDVARLDADPGLNSFSSGAARLLYTSEGS